MTTSVARLGVAALLLPLTGCALLPGAGSTDDDGPRATAGEVVPAAFADSVQGRSMYALVPNARYNFTVSDPVAELDFASASDAGLSQQAPDGSAFIGVTWQLEAVNDDGWVMLGGRERPAEIPVTLTVDGEEYALGDLGTLGSGDVDGTDRGGWAVVPEGADDVSLSVEFDGLVQTIDDVESPLGDRPDNGPSALYNGDPRLQQGSCDDPDFGTGPQDPQAWFGGACYRRASALPWFPEAGWAEDGGSWVVVDYRLDAATAGYDAPEEYVEYEVTGGEATITLDGQKPDLVLDDPDEDGSAGQQDDGGWYGVALFAVPDDWSGGEVVIRREYVGTPEDAAEAAQVGAPDPMPRTVRTAFDVED